MKSRYILISPVYNEEKHLDRLIKCVASQTIAPKTWIIVNDGSTDGTEEIIRRYETQYDFISQLKLERSSVESYYSRRTSVFLAGYQQVRNSLEYDFVGNLDADICLEPAYYEKILQEFARNPRLGIAGGVYVYQIDGRLQKVLIDELCVPGSLQMFRRECYEQIGGYIPLVYGGDDSLAGIMARMHGWETRSFTQYRAIQHRVVGTFGGKAVWKARFYQGLTEYGVATHPLFMLAKSLRRAFLERPYFFGSTVRLAGFIYGYLKSKERRVPDEVIRFHRKEQLQRLLAYPRRIRTGNWRVGESSA
ncbi:MAG: glycosyltransferase family A protein [Planctomycetota bacterium]|jgi:glycosyltransferase involved in cell wall biosynthesis